MTSERYHVPDIIERMAGDLRILLHRRDVHEPAMIGIHTGGAWVAEHLHRLLALPTPLGTLDISFYRDDFSRIGMHPQVRPSSLPFEVEDRHIVLVDDVLQSGRTVRAALNEIFDYGRPASVVLAVLVERTGRELPIQADISGVHMQLSPGEQVKLTGPDQLNLVVQTHERR
ncbi:MAG: bifunctional pyr operon transcriptional regulator/uracil phosphoribosyltransferase PyrR [Gammaproteobacteria bacterium]|nr:bifunctional pyr operon transcriptional regulator/uracil phosphoribosyltransferase PyrR [Gammaproteobacteria bacterium]